MRTLPNDFNVWYNKGQLVSLQANCQCQGHYRIKSNFVLSTFMKEHVDQKPQPAELNFSQKSLHKMMICVHSSTLWNLAGKTQYKKYHWNFYEEITIEHGLILKETRIIVPMNQRQHLFRQIHTGHLGLSKCL